MLGRGPIRSKLISYSTPLLFIDFASQCQTFIVFVGEGKFQEAAPAGFIADNIRHADGCSELEAGCFFLEEHGNFNVGRAQQPQPCVCQEPEYLYWSSAQMIVLSTI